MEWNLVNGHLTISGEITHTTNKSSDWPWSSQVENIQSVSFSNAYFTSGSNAYGMFEDCESLTSLDLSSFDTSNVTSMCSMFDSCKSLTSLDLSNFNTSNVTDMSYMFYDCDSLTSLDLSSFDTSNVTSMYSMFDYCDALTSLDLSNFNTSNVTDMSSMFSDCSSLTSLNLSNFNTSKVTYMEKMFSKCTALVSILWSTDRYEKTKDSTIDNTKNYYILNLSTNKYEKVENPINENIENYYNFTGFNTSNVTSMWGMFSYCSALILLDLSFFDTLNVTHMNEMFLNCRGLTSLDLSSFDTSNVTSMEETFYGCSSLLYIRISNLWTTVKVSDSFWMFNSCTNLPNYNSSSTDKTKAYAGAGGYLSDDVCAYYDAFGNTLNFIGCYTNQYTDGTVGTKTYYTNIEDMALTTAPGWLTDSTITTVNFYVIIKPKTTYAWFSGCSSLTTFNNLQLLDTSNVTDMSLMFYSCIRLASLNLSNFNTSNVTNMSHMFFNCRGLTSLNLSNFDTLNVTNMGDMFYNCRGLTSLNLSNFNTSNVTDMEDMFGDCVALTSLNLSSFNTSKVTDMKGTFYGCTALTSLDLSNFDTSNVTDMRAMFENSNGLTLLDLSSFNTSKVTMMDYMFYNCTATIPVLYVCQTECTTTGFVNNSQGTIYLVRDPEVVENTAVRDFWRSKANLYNNVHFEYDDATRPTITPEISRGKLVNNQWQADESGNIIKIKLNPQTYNNNISSVLSTNNIKSSGGLSIEVIDCNNYTVSQDSSINDLFYITLNTDPDKQYDANAILTDLSGIPVTRSIILPGVFAMIEFRAGGHGMSIGKICEHDGLEVDIPTAIGEKLLLPINNNTIDLTKNQLVTGQFNMPKNNALFVIGNGNENYRHNILEIYENEIHLTNGDNYKKYNFTELSDILLDDIITEVNNLDSNNFYLDNVSGLTSGAASYNVNSGKSQTSLKINLLTRTIISFSTYVSSESSCDYGAIYIGPQSYSPTRTQIANGTIDTNGGQYVYRKSGNQSLEEVSITLEPGEYYVSFIYAKDSSVNSNDDRFYIKSMTFKNVEIATTFTIDNNNISLNSAGDLITPTMAGQIIMFGGATSKIPLGWLPCDGSSVLIADYPLLAAALYDGSAYVWGQADSTHFNLPDLRGRAPIGVNGDAAATGLTARTVGTKNIGEETHTLKAAEAAQKAVSTNGMSANASHNHEMGYKIADRGSGSTDTRMGPYGHTTSGVTVINTASTSVAHTHSITGSDATTGHNNMQPSAVVNFIICTGQMSQ